MKIHRLFIFSLFAVVSTQSKSFAYNSALALVGFLETPYLKGLPLGWQLFFGALTWVVLISMLVVSVRSLRAQAKKRKASRNINDSEKL